MRFLFALSVLLFTASPVFAADGDMQKGSFGIMFCGAPATFDVTSQYPDSWVFNGHVLIRDTNEYDAIKITQFNDNSLRITRELRGANFGQKQTVETGPPTMERGVAVFRSDGGRGVGCNNPGAYTELRVSP